MIKSNYCVLFVGFYFIPVLVSAKLPHTDVSHGIVHLKYEAVRQEGLTNWLCQLLQVPAVAPMMLHQHIRELN